MSGNSKSKTSPSPKNQHNRAFFTPPNRDAAIYALERLQTERSEPILGTTENRRPENNSEWKSQKFHLQNVARKLLPKHRIRKCCRWSIPDKDVEIWRDGKNGQTHYRNLETCKDVWSCPVCSSRITERRAVELEKALDGTNYQTVMVTYTMRHHLGDSLGDTLDVLQKAIRSFKSGREWQEIKEYWGIVGTIKGLEITRSFDNGWHPHAHELFVMELERVLSDAQTAHLEDLLTERWLKMLKRHGGNATEKHGLNVTPNAIDQYIAKFKHEPVSQCWTLARELSKAASKRHTFMGSITPFQILELSQDDDQMKMLYLEYSSAMKGKRQMVWSKGLKDLILSSDEELMEDVPGTDDIKIISIPEIHWDAVVDQNARSKVLKIAKEGTIGEVKLFINICLYRERAKIAPAAHVLMHKVHPEYGRYK